jgi:phosphatidate cytidylyltransferase
MLAQLQDPAILRVSAGTVALLTSATTLGEIGKRVAPSLRAREIFANVATRTYAWWLMVAALLIAIAAGPVVALALYGIISFCALREFVALGNGTRRDRIAVGLALCGAIPLQYLLLGFHLYGLFAIALPVFAFAALTIAVVLSGDTRDFTLRATSLQWGVFACVYGLSYVPALFAANTASHPSAGTKLLIFLIVVVQMSDVLQYVFGKLCGKHAIAPAFSPNKTIEGFAGGVASATILGATLWWLTPFTPLEAAGMSLLLCLLGFCGGLVMSAFKRDRGLKDFGTLLPGHGGVLDRVDSLIFAAPVFFHLTRSFFSFAGF